MKDIWEIKSDIFYKANYPDWFDYSKGISPETDYDDIPFPDSLTSDKDEDFLSNDSEEIRVKKVILQTGRKKRNIFIPGESTKRFYRQLLPKLYTIHDRLAVEDVAHGFLPGFSCISQATMHIGYRYTISLDIKDFFDNVRRKHLDNYIEVEMLNYLLIDGSPRQGLPTSPIVANIALSVVDEKILEELNSLNFDKKTDLHTNDPNAGLTLAEMGFSEAYRVQSKPFVYTRYADDISVSFDNPLATNKIISVVKDVLERYGFALNGPKTKVLNGKNGHRIICGVGVSMNDIHITRKTKKKIRAARHQKNYSSLLGLYSWNHSLEKKKRR